MYLWNLIHDILGNKYWLLEYYVRIAEGRIDWKYSSDGECMCRDEGWNPPRDMNFSFILVHVSKVTCNIYIFLLLLNSQSKNIWLSEKLLAKWLWLLTYCAHVRVVSWEKIKERGKQTGKFVWLFQFREMLFQFRKMCIYCILSQSFLFQI